MQRLLPFGIALLALGLALVLVLGGILSSADPDSPQDAAVFPRSASLPDDEDEDLDDDESGLLSLGDEGGADALVPDDSAPSTVEDAGVLAVESDDADDRLSLGDATSLPASSLSIAIPPSNDNGQPGTQRASTPNNEVPTAPPSASVPPLLGAQEVASGTEASGPEGPLDPLPVPPQTLAPASLPASTPRPAPDVEEDDDTPAPTDNDTTDNDGIDTTDNDGIDTTDGDGIDTTDGDGIDTTDGDGIDTTDGDGIDTPTPTDNDGTDSDGIDTPTPTDNDGTDSDGIDTLPPLTIPPTAVMAVTMTAVPRHD